MRIKNNGGHRRMQGSFGGESGQCSVEVKAASVQVGNLAVAISNLGADLLKDDWGMMMCDAVMQTGDGK